MTNAIDKQLVKILACPDCQGEVKLKRTKKLEYLVCTQCKRKFEIKNGIPRMLPKEILD